MRGPVVVVWRNDNDDDVHEIRGPYVSYEEALEQSKKLRAETIRRDEAASDAKDEDDDDYYEEEWSSAYGDYEIYELRHNSDELELP